MPQRLARTISLAWPRKPKPVTSVQPGHAQLRDGFGGPAVQPDHALEGRVQVGGLRDTPLAGGDDDPGARGAC